MNRSSITAGILLVCLLSVCAFADEPKEQADPLTIPLDQIWGYNLPGTRDIAGIPLPETHEARGAGQSNAFLRRERESSIEGMRRALTNKPPIERAASGFVIPRQPDFYTLRALRSVLLRDTKIGPTDYLRENKFPAGDNLTLVFFSHPTSYNIRLKKVERQGNSITVHYQFEPRATVESTVHFALIPLGELPPDEYKVRCIQLPMERKFIEAGFEPVDPEAFEVISQPFSFTISQESSAEDDTPSKGAIAIPLDQILAYYMPGTRDVRELDAVKQPTGVTENPITNRIIRWLVSQRLEQGRKVPPGFVVRGTSKEALENAHSVFAEKTEPVSVFPTDTELSLVFYSYTSGRYVRIVSAERSKRTILVKYRLVTHSTGESTVHFALIPLGALSEGVYDVKIKQVSPIDTRGQPSRPLPNPERIVCDGLTFRIQEEEP